MQYKPVFSFGGDTLAAAGLPDTPTIIKILGGKGGNLAKIHNMGIPVPPGFTISTEVCTYFYGNERNYPPQLKEEVEKALEQVEEITGHHFGDPDDPQLVSVRSGARASMPGMMDTVLNLGMNDIIVGTIAKRTNNPRYAWDCYRRLIEMYSDVVLGINKEGFDAVLDRFKEKHDLKFDTELSANDWKEVVASYKYLVIDRTGKPFPQDPHEQLWGAIGAVFLSWMNTRAIIYRGLHKIPESWGTAVTVQAMVFGNMGDDCATGVAFTRNPSTGAKEFYGEFLVNAQGEDVVAGTRDPQPLAKLAEVMPQAYSDLAINMQKLEKHFRDMQDVEFTVERGKLWMLQTRGGKRTAVAAIRIAHDMAREGLIKKDEAVLRVDPSSLDQLFHPVLADPASNEYLLTVGLPASPGAVSGEIVFSSKEAAKLAKAGKKVTLVRIETSPEDIGGMHAAEGVLTARGGMTSHAAVVGRGMGKPCVAGASALNIDYDDQSMTVDGARFSAGDPITICGMTGKVFYKEVATVKPELPEEYHTLMEWEKSFRRMKVRANAETPADARKARGMGAEGIGLARTEHMFFEKERIPVVRDMFLAENEKDERAALDKLLPMQRADFIELFKIMDGQPVNIRLLDAPLNEFLSADDPRSARLHEFNPMLGKRACRLALLHPAIYKMQTRAIIEAAIETGFSVNATEKPSLEIMVPLIAFQGELEQIVVQQIRETIREVLSEHPGIVLGIKIGTMIETPRAALRAGELAPLVDYLSFGTNDLTQTTAGFSRDDLSEVISRYIDLGIFATDIFVSLDQEGVGELIMIAATRARAANPNITLGVCGEHGGDPESIAFFDKLGFNYVSCSPFRVPIARLAAAQAAIMARKSDTTK